jgi:hypothetical protein
MRATRYRMVDAIFACLVLGCAAVTVFVGQAHPSRLSDRQMGRLFGATCEACQLYAYKDCGCFSQWPCFQVQCCNTYPGGWPFGCLGFTGCSSQGCDEEGAPGNALWDLGFPPPGGRPWVGADTVYVGDDVACQTYYTCDYTQTFTASKTCNADWSGCTSSSDNYDYCAICGNDEVTDAQSGFSYACQNCGS